MVKTILLLLRIFFLLVLIIKMCCVNECAVVYEYSMCVFVCMLLDIFIIPYKNQSKKRGEHTTIDLYNYIIRHHQPTGIFYMEPLYFELISTYFVIDILLCNETKYHSSSSGVKIDWKLWMASKIRTYNWFFASVEKHHCLFVRSCLPCGPDSRRNHFYLQKTFEEVNVCALVFQSSIHKGSMLFSFCACFSENGVSCVYFNSSTFRCHRRDLNNEI